MTVHGYRAAYNFFKNVFNRISIDGKGVEIRASVHLGRGYDKAFWSDGGRWDERGWLVVDDQSEATWDDWWDIDDNHFHAKWRAFYALEIVGHELTHGIVAHSAKLRDQQWASGRKKNWQSRHKVAHSEASTFNKHIADCFGIMLKHHEAESTVDTPGVWDLASGIWSRYAMTMKGHGWAADYLRTFAYDGRKSADSGSPRHMNQLQPFDDGPQFGLDPHVNCGIPNRAFYLVAMAFKGCSWDRVGSIWYDALVDPGFTRVKHQTFVGWRNLTVRHAEKRFGVVGRELMRSAWAGVGL